MKRESKDKNLSALNPITFFGDVKQELKKVSWTSSEELKLYTKITLISTIAMGLAVYLADLIFQGTLFGIDSVVRQIFG